MPDESTSQDQSRAETDALAAWQAVPYSVSREEAQRISQDYLDAARKKFEEQTGQLPHARQNTARQTEMQLNATGAQAYTNTYWWGFEIVLNAKAAEAAAAISELVGDLVGLFLPKNVALLVENACKVRAAVIRVIGKDYGCRLVSPWFSPLMLIPIPLAPKQDTSLWWTVMNAANRWSQDEKFTGHLSKANPALAEFRGKLYCVHRGDGDDKLWWTVYDPERNDGWSTDTAFPGHFSGDGPALAVYGDQLFCVHRGAGNDKSLWWTRFNGTSWSPDTRMNGATSRGPALATFWGILYCVYKDSNNDRLWYTGFGGASWGDDRLLGAHNTASNPALAVYNDRLYCVHRGGGNDQSLWWTRFDGNHWGPDTQLPNHQSREGTALAVYNNFLYCLHRGGGNDQNLWWTRFNGTSWNADTRLPGHMSAQGPAIVAYSDPNGTETQLFCVHRGA
ncbi:hypothetical protein [Nonomuraea sp. NPDC050643]|uniref:hypothetical protein n=1 Tax=Nonomuraea sp. NPDC050643 TaxID=3155660 RepID=UPI00340243DA